MRLSMWTAVGLGLVLAAAGVVRADLIGVNEVPKVVRQAAAKAAPEVDWLLARENDEPDGKDYVLLGKDRAERTVEYWGRDTQGYVRIEVPRDEVPGLVREALEAKEPNFKADFIQLTGMDVKHLVGYRFSGQDAAGKPRVILVSNDGKKVFAE